MLLPLLNKYGSIFDGLNDIIAHIAPPITCVFLLGIFWEKASAVSAKYTLWIGSAIGVLVFTVNKLYPDTAIGQIPFMMMAFYLFVICVIIQVTLSYAYPVKHTKESSTLYWRSPWEPLQGAAWHGLGNYKVLSVLLVFIMAILFYIFR
jgi:SSS family solute:Na+ symporter